MAPAVVSIAWAYPSIFGKDCLDGVAEVGAVSLEWLMSIVFLLKTHVTYYHNYFNLFLLSKSIHWPRLISPLIIDQISMILSPNFIVWSMISPLTYPVSMIFSPNFIIWSMTLTQAYRVIMTYDHSLMSEPTLNHPKPLGNNRVYVILNIKNIL